MNAYTCGLQSPAFGATPIQSGSIAPGHTEFVFVQAGGNIRMRFCCSIRVPPHRELRCLAKMHRARCQQLQFTGAFNVEKQNTGPERQIDLLGQLANSGENHVTRGFPSEFLYSLQFAAGNDVEPSAKPREQSQDREIRIGLHRITDGVVASPKSFVKLLVALADRRTGIHVERSAVQLSQPAERNRVGAHFQEGFAEEPLVSAISKCGRPLRWTFGFHFLEDVPFTLMATMV